VSRTSTSGCYSAPAVRPIVSVQNRYSLAERESESVLKTPSGTGRLHAWSNASSPAPLWPRPGGALSEVAGAPRGDARAGWRLAWRPALARMLLTPALRSLSGDVAPAP